jgi:hypothetical protein
MGRLGNTKRVQSTSKTTLACVGSLWKTVAFLKTAQQSVHLTLGILRKSQVVFYALSFFWLDGFAVPAPAQVTQSVGRLSSVHSA